MNAHSLCTPTVLVAESACVCVGGAARMHAHTLCTPTMLEAESSYFCFCGAARMHAHRPCVPTVLGTESLSLCFGGAARIPTQNTQARRNKQERVERAKGLERKVSRIAVTHFPRRAYSRPIFRSLGIWLEDIIAKELSNFDSP
jgi:hypothetical protein